MDISKKTSDIICEKIKELDSKELFDFIDTYKINWYGENFIIRLIDDYKKFEDDISDSAFIELRYSIEKDDLYIAVDDENGIIYDPYINNIPLINFAYENLDKIKAIIKQALECGNEKKYHKQGA